MHAGVVGVGEPVEDEVDLLRRLGGGGLVVAASGDDGCNEGRGGGGGRAGAISSGSPRWADGMAAVGEGEALGEADGGERPSDERQQRDGGEAAVGAELGGRELGEVAQAAVGADVLVPPRR